MYAAILIYLFSALALRVFFYFMDPLDHETAQKRLDTMTWGLPVPPSLSLCINFVCLTPIVNTAMLVIFVIHRIVYRIILLLLRIKYMRARRRVARQLKCTIGSGDAPMLDARLMFSADPDGDGLKSNVMIRERFLLTRRHLPTNEYCFAHLVQNNLIWRPSMIGADFKNSYPVCLTCLFSIEPSEDYVYQIEKFFFIIPAPTPEQTPEP